MVTVIHTVLDRGSKGWDSAFQRVLDSGFSGFWTLVFRIWIWVRLVAFDYTKMGVGCPLFQEIARVDFCFLR